MTSPFRGSIAALPTPFGEGSGELDLAAFGALVDHHVASGTEGLVVCGTTGETPTLTREERRSLIAACVEAAGGRVPVIAGVGTNATRSTVDELESAEELGVDGLLVVTPYYNRPSQAGLRLHFDAVAAAATLPVVLYNVPARTGVDLLPETAADLARRHANVVAIKEASPSVERLRELVATRALDVLCGEDTLAVKALRLGAAGWIGVLPNLAPAAAAELVGIAHTDPARCDAIWEELSPYLDVLALDVNPVPVKAALARQGRMSAGVRPPLAPLDAAAAKQLERRLEAFDGVAQPT